ncbi:ATP-binding protein [bacterium]|jgi:two-component system sensor histidine kinase RstB|nr:ATP-binding protein [Verrucomicrobiales bacterium]MDC3255674.1 ATP-binding protein [bacterium]MDF1790121.1 ATP-binding protein [Verrucomicrobiales bacterium]
MTRFYLRIIVVIFLAIMASIIAFVRLAKVWEERFFEPKAIKQLHKLAGTLDERLGGMDEAEAKAALEEIEKERGLPIHIVTVDNLTEVATTRPSDSKTKRLFLDLGDKPFGVMIQSDESLIKEYEEDEERYMGRGVVQMILIIGVAGFFIVRPLVKKLRVQEAILAEIADGNLSARVDIKGKDALGRLSQRLNSMADRIQELLGSQRQIIQAVSHEMRTPTSRIGFALEMLAESKTEEDRQRRIASLNEDLADMDALLEELLTFLRFEDGAQALDLESLNLLAMVSETERRVQRFRPELNITTQTLPEGMATLEAPVSRKYFPRVLENLLMNAMRHAKSHISVQVIPGDSLVEIHIDDDGFGVPDDQTARIFEPFVRLDPSRDRQTGGTGLGLAITKRIIDQHQGTITVSKSPLQGARFTILLPQKA